MLLQSTAENLGEAVQSCRTEAPNEEDLLRRAARKDLAQSRQAQMDAQIAFEGRREEHKQKLMDFERLTANGAMDYTRSDFDVEYGVQRT